MGGDEMEKPARRRGGVIQALRTMWRFLICAGFFSIFEMAAVDPLNAFFYSTTRCPVPQPDESGECPKGSLNDGAGTCVAEPSVSEEWSMSAHCMDKDVVISKTVRLKGMLQVPKNIMGLAVLVVAGPAIDTVGRKPMMLIVVLAHIAMCSLFWLASTVDSTTTSFKAAVIGAFVALGACSSIFRPVSQTMVADLARGDEKRRGDGFAALGMMNNMTILVGFGAMFPVLNAKLTDYSGMWAMLTAAGIVEVLLNVFVLHETMPNIKEEGGEGDMSLRGGAFKQGMRLLMSGAATVVSSSFLRSFILITGFVTVSMASLLSLMTVYQVEALDYGNAQASLCGITLPVIGTIAALLASTLIRRIGAYRLNALASLGMAIAMAVVGFGAASPKLGVREAAFWSGLVFMAWNWSVIITCIATLVSTHVPKANQGAVFAFQALLVGTLESTLGLLWPEVFFRANSTGLRRGMIFLASSGITFVCFLALLLCWPDERVPDESCSEWSEDDTEDHSDSESS